MKKIRLVIPPCPHGFQANPATHRVLIRAHLAYCRLFPREPDTCPPFPARYAHRTLMPVNRIPRTASSPESANSGRRTSAMEPTLTP
jgi:hypothetical protein